MTRVVLIAHTDFLSRAVEAVADEATPVPCATFEEVADVLATGEFDAAVLVTDGFHEAGIASAAAAARACARPVVEVRKEGWDGETHSPLTAAVRGIIAGFGPGGAKAAVRFLLESS